jgi:putative chitinase
VTSNTSATISPAQLQRIMGIKPALAARWAPYIAQALLLSDCTTPQRRAAWLAQIGHESGCLRYTRELWGPTPQQLRYEPGTTLATRLGNTQPGDGKLYMGRGLIQITGRANYRQCAERMAGLTNGATVPDFEAEPDQLERPHWAALSAALYWRTRNLNRWADSGDFAELTRRINGGYNGLAHRQHLYVAAMAELTKEPTHV